MKTLICILACLLGCPLTADAFCRKGFPCRKTNPKNIFGSERCNMPRRIHNLPVVSPIWSASLQTAKHNPGLWRTTFAGDLKLGQQARLVLPHHGPVDGLVIGLIPHGQDLYVEFSSQAPGFAHFVVHGMRPALVSSKDAPWVRQHRVTGRESLPTVLTAEVASPSAR